VTRITKQDYCEDSSETPLDFLINVAASHTGNSPSSLPVLNDRINCDLINIFLRNPPAAGTLRFKWENMVVVLTADRQVIIRSFDNNSRSRQEDSNMSSPRVRVNSPNIHATQREDKK
jgi:hypothetical protein